MVNSKSPFIAKEFSKRCNLRPDWYENRQKFMLEVIIEKTKQHKELRTNLINSGLKPIIHFTKNDKFWGNGPENNGQNILGRILMEVRKQLLTDLL